MSGKGVFLGVAVLIATAMISFGQGTVYFANASTLSFITVTDRNVKFGSTFGVIDPTLVGANVSSNAFGYDFSGLRAQLFYSVTPITDINAMNPVSVASNGITSFKQSTSTTAGSWFNKNATLTGWYNYSPAYLAVVVWDSRLSTDALSASAQAGPWGMSAIFTYLIYQPPEEASYTMDNLRSFEINIPEPTVLALAGLGGFAFACARRRRGRLISAEKAFVPGKV